MTPTLNVGEIVVENNCTLHEEDNVVLEGSVNLTGVEVDVWSSSVDFRIQNENSSSESLVLCQVDLSTCSSLSQLGCYCKKVKDSLYTVILNETADVQRSEKMIYLKLASLDSSAMITSDRTLYPYVSETIEENLEYGHKSGLPPVNDTVLNIPTTDQEVRYTVTGLREPYSIIITAPGRSDVFTNQPTVSAQVNESLSFITFSYEEHSSCRRKGSHIYTPKDLWRDEPLLTIGQFNDPGPCVLPGSDIGMIEATADFTGVDESSWLLIVGISFINETIPPCNAMLTMCPPDWYASVNCYCKERRGHLYTIVFNQTAVLSYSEKHLVVRAYQYTEGALLQVLDSTESAVYPYVNRYLDVVIQYGFDGQFPPINNSRIYVPDDDQVVTFIVDRMRHPSSISYTLSGPSNTSGVFVNQTTVNITVYSTTDYMAISYREEMFCERSATYYFTLKGVPLLQISSVNSPRLCPLAGEDFVTIEGVVDFTGVDKSAWILVVNFYTASNASLCEVSLSNCGETVTTSCYCMSKSEHAYTVVFNDTADLALSLQTIYLGMNRRDDWAPALVAEENYLFVGGLDVTMSYGSVTQSPPINNSRIYVPDDSLEIQFNVSGIRHPSSIPYKLSSPNHGWEFVNESSVNIRVYDSTNFITISYEEKESCRRSASYHFTLKDVYRPEPTLSIGPITSSEDCVLAGKSMVTFDAVVNFTGVDYSGWILSPYFVTPAAHFNICPVTLVNCGEGDTSTLQCYCERHQRDVYNIVFNVTADIVHSEQPIYFVAQRTDFSTIRTDGNPRYPFVNEDIKVAMTFGNSTQWTPVNNSIIYIPDDNQVILVTVTGMRHPSSVGYRLSIPDIEREFENQTNVNITVYDSTNYITIWYEEKYFCRRSAYYTFTLKATDREDPTMNIGPITSNTDCVLAGTSRVTLEAVVDFTGVDYSDWILVMFFVTPVDSSNLCPFSIVNCQDMPQFGCYCQSHLRDVYTIVFNVTADPVYSEQPIYLRATRTDLSTIQTDGSLQYPLVIDLNVTVSYGNMTQFPPINNSTIDVPDDDQAIQFEVKGLSHPSSISYSLSRPDRSWEFANESSATIAVFDYTNYITISYEEKAHCKRSATYDFTLKAVYREDPVLNVGPVTSGKECVLTGRSLVTFDVEVDFTGVDYSKWGLFFYLTTPPGHLSLCVFSVENCGENMTLPCYCKSHDRDVYSIVFNTTADDPVHSELPILLIGSRMDYTPIRTETGPEYPYVNVDINVTMTFGNSTQWTPVNNSMIYIPDDNQVILVTVTGMRHPSSVGYRLSSPRVEREFENQTSITITVYDSTNYITIWYEEKDFCRRSAYYTFTLKAVNRQDPTLTIGPITSNTDCVLAGTTVVTFEAVVNFTGVDYSDWSSTLNFTTSTNTESICHVSLTQCDPVPSEQCYCKDHVRDVYNIVFNATADSSLGLQLISLTATRQNLSTLQADEFLQYPFVSEHINITLNYGNEIQSPPINNSKIYVPDQNLVTVVTLSGLRHPSSLSYNLSSPDGYWEFENQSSLNISVTNSTNLLVVRYAEKDFCQRSASYHFPVKVVWREDPQVATSAFQVGDSATCVINGHNYVAMESTIDFMGVDDSQWLQTVNFIASSNVVCNASLLECPPASPHPCYCKYRREDTYTVVFNDTADASLNGQMAQLVAYRRDNSTVQGTEAVGYPFVSGTIDVKFEYAYQGIKPFINNTIQEILDDHKVITFTLNGLSKPYRIQYMTADDPGQVTTVMNNNTVTLPVSETKITITYEEMQYCQRRDSFIITMEDNSSDGLSRGAIVGLVFGGLVLIVFIIAVLVVAFNKNCWCKSRKRSTYTTADRVYVDGPNSTHL